MLELNLGKIKDFIKNNKIENINIIKLMYNKINIIKYRKIKRFKK